MRADSWVGMLGYLVGLGLMILLAIWLLRRFKRKAKLSGRIHDRGNASLAALVVYSEQIAINQFKRRSGLPRLAQRSRLVAESLQTAIR